MKKLLQRLGIINTYYYYSIISENGNINSGIYSNNKGYFNFEEFIGYDFDYTQNFSFYIIKELNKSEWKSYKKIIELKKL